MSKESASVSREVQRTIRIQRFNPHVDIEPSFKEYRFPLAMVELHTLHSLLQHIYDNVDHTLAFRGACGRGVCGSCTIRINGRPGLSCMRKIETDLTVEPMARFPVIRDLVVDLRPATTSSHAEEARVHVD